MNHKRTRLAQGGSTKVGRFWGTRFDKSQTLYFFLFKMTNFLDSILFPEGFRT